MARARNPRVVAVEILKDLKRNADAIRARWVQRSSRTVYEHSTETRMAPKFYGQEVSERNPLVHTPNSTSTTRERRPEEYPETQSAEWATLWVYADDMARHAEELKALALAEWKKFPGNAGYTLTRKGDS